MQVVWLITMHNFHIIKINKDKVNAKICHIMPITGFQPNLISIYPVQKYGLHMHEMLG